MRKLVVPYLMLGLGLVLLLASCAGGGALDAPSPGLSAAVTETELAGTATGELPAIPLDVSEDKTSSAESDPALPPPPGDGEQAITVLGKDYVQVLNGVVDGDALVLSAPAAVDDEAQMPPLAYATYRVTGMDGRRALSLNIECLPAQLGQDYFVGVADYTDFKWRWFGPVTIPEFQLDLRGHNHEFVTQLGNMYFILVCRAGNEAKHFKTTVLTGPRDPGQLPGGPHHLEASKGALEGKIALHWQAGVGVEHYDVLRKPARQDAQWSKIGETADTHYLDAPVPNNVLFFYHVVAFNGNGQSARSNVDAGFAGMAADVCLVRGDVTGLNGTPLPGIRVVLIGRGEEAMCKTDADGKFRFFGLPPGRYVVAPMRPELDFLPPYAIADVREARVADLHFNAVPEAPFHRIKGFAYEYVVDPNGAMPPALQPMAGLTIQAHLATQPEHLITVQTDDNGFYHFEDLAEGIYLIRAVKDGYGFVPAVHEVVVNGTNRPDRRDFIGFAGGVPDPPADGGGNGTP